MGTTVLAAGAGGRVEVEGDAEVDAVGVAVLVEAVVGAAACALAVALGAAAAGCALVVALGAAGAGCAEAPGPNSAIIIEAAHAPNASHPSAGPRRAPFADRRPLISAPRG